MDLRWIAMGETALSLGADELIPIDAPESERISNLLSDVRSIRIGVLSNPLSGGNRNGLSKARDILANKSCVVYQEVRTPADVARCLADFARREVDVVAINGGDGTIHAALTTLFHERPFGPLPLLALLRAGTASMLAKDIGLRGSRDQALRKLVAWRDSGKGNPVILQRPVLRVQSRGHKSPLYGMFFGAACIYQGIRFFHAKLQNRGLHGELAHGLILARYLLAVASNRREVVTPQSLTIDWSSGRSEHRQVILLLISTLERLILGLRPYWGSEQGPLHFTAVEAKPKRLLTVVLNLLRGRVSRHLMPELGYRSHKISRVRLTLQGGFTLDGELYRPDLQPCQLTVENGGQASFLQL
jgi:diacylglycerol kinase (ATP)